MTCHSLLCYFLFSEILIGLLSFRMEITAAPLHITSFQRFDADAGTQACHRYLLERAIDSYPDLLGALSPAFGIQPDDLCVHVHDMFTSMDREVQTVVENWLISYSIMRKQYLCFVVNRRKPIDGLFLWLSVHTMRQHINVLHASGVWTSRCSDITILTDASLVLILNCCLVTKLMTREEIQKRDDEYTEQVCDPHQCLQNYIHMPWILNNPVKKH